jgi:hypothetical protein
MQRSMFVVRRHVHMHQLRTRLEHRAHLYGIAAAHCIRQAFDVSAIHISLELGPTVEAVATGQHKLGIMQREVSRAGIVIVCVYQYGGIGLAGNEAFQQFLRLALELIEIRMFAQRATRLRLSHK